MKGVVLAGGSGARLMPLTKITNKHLLPVFNKPMIYYPLECLVRAGIDEVLLVTGGNHAGEFLRLLGNGKELGLRSLQYTYQERAGGIAEALALAKDFAEHGPIVLVLGDNILEKSIAQAVRDFRQQKVGAKILLSPVENPQAYGIAEVKDGRVVSIVEKPANPKSKMAVIGIYFYDQHVFEFVAGLKPSARGELEITDVNNAYLQRGQLTYNVVDGWWGDAGEDIEFYMKCCNQVAKVGANHAE